MATASTPLVKSASSKPPAVWRRVVSMTAVAMLLILLFSRTDFLASPSEYFHAVVPLLWLFDFIVYQRHYKTIRRPIVAVIAGVAMGLLIFFWQFANMLAASIGGMASWIEPFYKLSLVASYMVLYTLFASAFTYLLDKLPFSRKRIQQPAGWRLRMVRSAIPLLLFAPCLFSSFNIHRFKIANVSTPLSRFNLPYEAVSFPSAEDNIMLSGWFIPSKNSDSTIVVCHGIGANKSNFMDVAPFLHRAGFNVLMFDFRGHGDSPGHTSSFGYYEARDVRGAVRYLQQRGEKKIAALAFSMGGAALLHSVDNLPELRGVVVDSTFAEFAPLVEEQVAFLPSGLRRFIATLTDIYGQIELGVSSSEISSRQHLATISPRPIFIIHGTGDTMIAPWHAKANFASAREPKQLWMVEGANHCQCLAVATTEYEKRVKQFFLRCLK